MRGLNSCLDAIEKRITELENGFKHIFQDISQKETKIMKEMLSFMIPNESS